jgi:hypothetical protein
MEPKNKLHSITFYISAKKLEQFMSSVRKASEESYGGGKRTVSKYIRGLIDKDLKERGFLEEKQD